MVPCTTTVPSLEDGRPRGATEDCTAVLASIGTAYHPACEAEVARAEEGAAVDLADAVVKAYRRRADADEEVDGGTKRLGGDRWVRMGCEGTERSAEWGCEM